MTTIPTIINGVTSNENVAAYLTANPTDTVVLFPSNAAFVYHGAIMNFRNDRVYALDAALLAAVQAAGIAYTTVTS